MVYKDFYISYHNHDNVTRDYFVHEYKDGVMGRLYHYTNSEENCIQAIDTGNFNFEERTRKEVR